MSTLTVIIPVYNVLPYLRQCLDSVVVASLRALAIESNGQSAPSIEVLCVDDGATDGSAAVLDEYAERFSSSAVGTHPAFRVLHQKNGGVSVARNAAIEVAKGDWLHFIDADDWVGENIYVDMCQRIRESEDDVDAIAFLATQFDLSGRISSRWGEGCESIEITGDDLLGSRTHRIFTGCIWNKVYRKAVIDQEKLRFLPHVQPAEDDLFNKLFLSYCRKVRICTDFGGYFYRATPGSSVHTMNLRKLMYHADEFHGLYTRWKEIHSPGLGLSLLNLAKALVCLGCSTTTEFRGECIQALMGSSVFNHEAIPYLIAYGDVKSRLFAFLYQFVKPLRRKLLGCVAA